jgi:hypothetical protein
MPTTTTQMARVPPSGPPMTNRTGSAVASSVPKKGNDRRQAGEDAEGERVRHVQHAQPDRGERGEEAHREQQPDDVRPQRVGAVGQDVAHEITMDGREERDQPLAVQRGMDREVQPHHADGEDADQHLDDAEHLRHDVVELRGDLIVQREEQLVLPGS